MQIVIVAAAAVMLLVLVVLLRRGGADRRGDLIAPPPGLGGKAHPPRPTPAPPAIRAWPEGAAPIGALADAVDAEARRLMALDRKIEAIKLVRAATRWDLRTAKEWVERL
jgi:hypothetical protein